MFYNFTQSRDIDAVNIKYTARYTFMGLVLLTYPPAKYMQWLTTDLLDHSLQTNELLQ